MDSNAKSGGGDYIAEKPSSGNVETDVITTSSGTEHPIAAALERFLHRLDDLRTTAHIAIPAVGKAQMAEVKKHQKRLDKFLGNKSDEELEKELATDPHASRDLTEASSELTRLHNSKVLEVLVRSLFIGIFSEYDVFVGELWQAIHEKKPDLFKSIKREVTLSDLLNFESVDAVKKDILEKEIDSFRRNSYVEQFVEMEKKFEIKTLRNFPEWPKFVEVGQRRNILTHNGGICSEQYLSMCEREGYRFEVKPERGTDLNPDGKYFGETLFVITKVAFMLSHTLWRKLLPNEIAEADSAMNIIIFHLLEKERWKYAAELGKFGLSEDMRRKASDIDIRIRVVNTAIALVHTGDKDLALKTINAIDWTASLRDFQLAIAILREDYNSAAILMRSIGKRGELIDQLAYHGWPLFYDFREQRQFLEAYEAVYGVPFAREIAKEAKSVAEREEPHHQNSTDSIRVSTGIKQIIGVIPVKIPEGGEEISARQRKPKKKSAGISKINS
jgi:hypothetical protein